MSYEFSREAFHKLLLVLCRGSIDRTEYNTVIDIVFEGMEDDQRNYYWESYCESKGTLDVLNALGLNMNITTEHKEPVLPDNVHPIR